MNKTGANLKYIFATIPLLYWIILGGAIARVTAAVYSIGFMDPNEIYRFFEPLTQLQGFATHPAWEWRDGLLFQWPIYFHLFLLKFMSALGLNTAPDQALVFRLGYALLGVLPILAAHTVVEKKIAKPSGVFCANFAAALIAFWPEWIFRSVRIMDYSLEAAVIAGVLVMIGGQSARGTSSLRWVGILLGLLFFVRPQSGLYLIAVGVSIFWARSSRADWRAQLFNLGFAYCCTLILGGILESTLTHQGFLSPFFKYWDFNVTQGGAALHYGVDPWHRYISESAKQWGFLPYVFSMGLVGIFFKTRLRHPSFWIYIIPFVIFSLIAHKEDRFILGFSWLLAPIAVSIWAELRPSLQGPRAWTFVAGIFGIGLAFQIARHIPRWEVNAERVRIFFKFGSSASDETRSRPLLVFADPDFSPGGFYLRWKGPICYSNDSDHKERCPNPVVLNP